MYIISHFFEVYYTQIKRGDSMLKIKKTEYQNKTFRLPVPLIERLAQTAQKNDISMTKLVIELCEYGLENLDESEE